jgi:hypothetical protein
MPTQELKLTLNQPKVRNFHVSIVVDQQVGGLYVPVDLVLAVDKLQALPGKQHSNIFRPPDTQKASCTIAFQPPQPTFRMRQLMFANALSESQPPVSTMSCGYRSITKCGWMQVINTNGCSRVLEGRHH